MRRNPLLAFSPVLFAGLLAGCPAPDAKFDDFETRADPYFAQFEGGVCPSSPPMMADGQYLFSFTPIPESPDVPAPFLTDVTVTAEGLTINLQPLSATDRMTEIGMPRSYGPFPIDGNGQFTIVLDGIEVPPDTNPLTDSTLVGTFDLPGGFCTDDQTIICGTFEGSLTVPAEIPLSGTWAMQRLDGGAIVEPPVVDCDGGTAAPL